MTELKWLGPDAHAELVWDSSMGEDPAKAAAVLELVGRAMRGPLLPAQQQQVRPRETWLCLRCDKTHLRGISGAVHSKNGNGVEHNGTNGP